MFLTLWNYRPISGQFAAISIDTSLESHRPITVKYTKSRRLCFRLLLMDSPQTNIAIDQLAFSLFQRPLHPELFQIYARRRLKNEKYEAIIWITGCTHVVSVFCADTCLTEVISAPGQPLPKQGLIEHFQFHGSRSHKCTLSKSISYMTDFQVEKMSTNLYRQSHKDLEKFARNRGVFVKFPKLEVGGLQPFCYVDFEARRHELHIHAFSAYPDQVAMIKTQSLFDLR